MAERTASLQMANEDLRHNEKIIRHLVLTDPLTEVANRRCLNERLDQEINRLRRYRRPLSLILCDIDFFKKVNDTYGHDIGDLVLKVFATTVKSALRREDLLGRYGGEEFVVILPETVIKQAGEVAERIRTRIESLALAQVPNGVTASFGVAEAQEGDNQDDLIRRADQTLYTSKHTGRNRVTLDEPSLAAV